MKSPLRNNMIPRTHTRAWAEKEAGEEGVGVVISETIFTQVTERILLFLPFSPPPTPSLPLPLPPSFLSSRHPSSARHPPLRPRAAQPRTQGPLPCRRQVRTLLKMPQVREGPPSCHSTAHSTLWLSAPLIHPALPSRKSCQTGNYK